MLSHLKLAVAASCVSSVISAARAMAAYPILSELSSDVYQAPSDHAAITRGATICAVRVLNRGLRTIPVITSAEPETGVVVALSAFKFTVRTFFGPVIFDAQSTVAIEAKDGRFRITYSDLEMLYGNKWEAVEKTPRLVDGVRHELTGISTALASCINANKDNWPRLSFASAPRRVNAILAVKFEESARDHR